jgi:sulfur-oxidizing protein SoxB
MEVQGADIALSPGFRWGTTLLPGDPITRELMMDQLAITYPYTTLNEMSGESIKGNLSALLLSAPSKYCFKINY